MVKTNRLWLAVIALLGVGCGEPENSPEMGAAPPKPDPNMNARLPDSVREQLQRADPDRDASAMSKPHRSSNPSSR
jgi:hypothetical protein